jgi:hypothetical protein
MSVTNHPSHRNNKEMSDLKKTRHNYMYVYMSYFLQIRKLTLLICASLDQTVKLGLLDRRWDKCPLTSVTTHLWCITSQKSNDLICTMEET